MNYLLDRIYWIFVPFTFAFFYGLHVWADMNAIIGIVWFYWITGLAGIIIGSDDLWELQSCGRIEQ